jgi:hypothetical protein
MRFDRTPKVPAGTKRVRAGFLWLPVTCLTEESTLETRWLERALWSEVRTRVGNGIAEDGYLVWKPLSWID